MGVEPTIAGYLLGASGGQRFIQAKPQVPSRKVIGGSELKVIFPLDCLQSGSNTLRSPFDTCQDGNPPCSHAVGELSGRV